jgi:ArsR family transcriptional regulator, arsenate/arsenite/antimonite-responsive transcriptional repressor
MECDSVPFVSVDLTITPKQKRAAGERCCDPVALPEVDAAGAGRIAVVAKALSDPVRVQLVDVLRRHAGEVCVCELEPLFAISQPTLSHHLRKLREAGIVGVERRGLWAYYYVHPEPIEELHRWLS